MAIRPTPPASSGPRSPLAPERPPRPSRPPSPEDAWDPEGPFPLDVTPAARAVAARLLQGGGLPPGVLTVEEVAQALRADTQRIVALAGRAALKGTVVAYMDRLPGRPSPEARLQVIDLQRAEAHLQQWFRGRLEDEDYLQGLSLWTGSMALGGALTPVLLPEGPGRPPATLGAVSAATRVWLDGAHVRRVLADPSTGVRARLGALYEELPVDLYRDYVNQELRPPIAPPLEALERLLGVSAGETGALDARLAAEG